MNYCIVKYSGPFGFIKPWTAVRDSETFSQQFLTPSIVEGIEKKLFPELLKEPFGKIYKIKRHRLSYEQISPQQEQVQPRGWNKVGRKNEGKYERPYAVTVRGVLLNPSVWIAFDNLEDASIAYQQHICLARNEDILYPEQLLTVSHEDFDTEDDFPGFELIFEKTERSFLVGYHRYKHSEPMYGWLKTFGTPVKAF
jgi:hypothetical protein